MNPPAQGALARRLEFDLLWDKWNLDPTERLALGTTGHSVGIMFLKRDPMAFSVGYTLSVYCTALVREILVILRLTLQPAVKSLIVSWNSGSANLREPE